MKKLILLLVSAFTCVILSAQEAIWSGQNITSPEIHADNTVTFRLFAPNADSVVITGNFLPEVITKVENGVLTAPGKAYLIKGDHCIWEYTTPQPLESELYSYSFIVDGLNTTDPNNVYLIRDVSTLTNVFVIGNGQGDLYSVNSVPHGTVTRRWYNSPTLNIDRRITIYTPPGYEAGKKNYPVLYLLHGMGGDEEAWISLGRTAQIMDNLIAAGKAQPMIVVMPNGNVVQEAAPGESSLGYYKPIMRLPKSMDGSMESSFPDIVSFVDSNYRTIRKKSARAIAGLSMGGFHSLHISLNYPDMFDYVGLFSAAILPRGNNESPIYADRDEKLEIQFMKQPKLYWIAIGKDDFLYIANEEYRKILDKNAYPYTYVETEGGHIWKNWRIYLSDFVPMLFK